MMCYEGAKGNTMSTYGLTCHAEIWRSELKIRKEVLVLQTSTGYVYWEGSDERRGDVQLRITLSTTYDQLRLI